VRVQIIDFSWNCSLHSRIYSLGMVMNRHLRICSCIVLSMLKINAIGWRSRRLHSVCTARTSAFCIFFKLCGNAVILITSMMLKLSNVCNSSNYDSWDISLMTNTMFYSLIYLIFCCTLEINGKALYPGTISHPARSPLTAADLWFLCPKR